MADKVRLIDANKLKQGLEVLCKDERVDILAVTYFAIVGFIDNMPTIEAEPCTFCAYNPPSSCDGKPCTVCPAHKRSDGDDETKSED